MSATLRTSPTAAATYAELHGFQPTEAAGLRQLRRPQGTTTLVGVYDARQAGIEDDPDVGRWATVCEVHATCVMHDTLQLARWHAADPTGWCEPCREPQEGEG